MSIIGKISGGLSKTREKIAQALQMVFAGGANNWDLLEELLILADAGPKVAAQIVDQIKKEGREPLAALKEKLMEILTIESEDRSVKVFIGVNGSGKTTSLGKLSNHLLAQGKSVFVIGADTFRAAADAQLEGWCKRLSVPYFVGKPGADPASVMFDGLNSSAARNADYILCDTAGRLHSNKNLTQELDKILRVARRLKPEAIETLVTLDAGTGQNALAQMAVFSQWLNPGGVILTKLDGSAKGGVAIAVAAEFGVPIKYVGVGEKPDDLLPFSAVSYVESLLP